MQSAFFSLTLKSVEENKELFLKDPKSDFIVVCGSKVFPLHKKLLSPSLYLSEKAEENKRVFVID